MQSPEALMTSSDATTRAGGIRRPPDSRPPTAAGMYQAGSGPSAPVPVSTPNGTASAGTSMSGSAASASALSSSSPTSSTASSCVSVPIIGSLPRGAGSSDTEGTHVRPAAGRGDRPRPQRSTAAPSGQPSTNVTSRVRTAGTVVPGTSAPTTL